MKTTLVIALLFLSGLFVKAQTPNATAPAPNSGVPFVPQTILAGGIVLPLYPPDSPMLKKERIHEAERYNTTGSGKDKIVNVINIHNPSIEAHIVGDAAGNTGAAVVVAPGGGHKILWVGPEGADCAPFFAEQGVSTIILRNRLRVDGYEPRTDAVDDALQAIRIVRAHATEWKLDPSKIGIMGFSAGGELAAGAALSYEDFQKRHGGSGDPLAAISPRPDFVALIYPGPSPFSQDAPPQIPSTVPPTFITCAGSGDRVHALWATDYFTAMLKASVPNIEMHIYGAGSHGGAISKRNGIPFGTWQDRYLEWFRDLGFLGKPGAGTKAAMDVAAYAKKK